MGTQKKIFTVPSGNQDGFVLVVALMMLMVLSVVGIVALNTTDIELQIAGNDRQEKRIFYGTESGCMRGGQWLRNLQLAVTDDYVDDDLLATYISDGNFNNPMDVRDVTEGEESNLGDTAYPVKYRYDIDESADTSGTRLSCMPIPGNNPNILECYYGVDCSSTTSSGGARQIAIRVNKPTDFE